MTVASALNRKTYAGDDATTVFATSPVVFFEAADLDVYTVVDATGVETLLTLNTDYTVSGGSATGAVGTVDLSGGSAPYGALPTGETLLILRVLDLLQESDYVQNDPSDANVQETAIDRLTMIVQQLSEENDRAIQLPVTSSLVGVEMPDPTDQAGKVVVVNSAEDGFSLVAAVDIDVTPASAFIATVLDDEGRACKPGTVGRLAVKGPTGCRYLDDPERQKVYVRNGWNYPGDVYEML